MLMNCFGMIRATRVQRNTTMWPWMWESSLGRANRAFSKNLFHLHLKGIINGLLCVHIILNTHDRDLRMGLAGKRWTLILLRSSSINSLVLLALEHLPVSKILSADYRELKLPGGKENSIKISINHSIVDRINVKFSVISASRHDQSQRQSDSDRHTRSRLSINNTDSLT